MSIVEPSMMPGWLRAGTREHGTLELIGPEPGPAGEVSLLVAPGLFVSFDAADPGVITLVEIDDEADAMDVADLLGRTGVELAGAQPGTAAALDDSHGAEARRAAARLALLLGARQVPAPAAASAAWSFDALLLAADLAERGFDQSGFLAEQAAGVATELLAALDALGPNPPAETLAVRAAHIAMRYVDPGHPAWLRLHDATADLPDLLGDQPPMQAVRPDRVDELPEVARARGEERPAVRSFSLLWPWLERDVRPEGAAFEHGIQATIDWAAQRLTVTCRLRPGSDRPVFVRVVARDTLEVVSLFAMTPHENVWAGEGPLPAAAAEIRIDVVSTLAAAVYSDESILAHLGAQWAWLALDAERAGALAVAASQWRRAAARYDEARKRRAKVLAERYAAQCEAGIDDEELGARRQLPFTAELGPDPFDERGSTGS